MLADGGLSKEVSKHLTVTVLYKNELAVLAAQPVACSFRKHTHSIGTVLLPQYLFNNSFQFCCPSCILFTRRMKTIKGK